MQKLILLVTGLLLVLITGVFWGTWFSLSRTMYEFPPDVFIMIGKEIIKNVAVPMSIIMPASLIGLLYLLAGSRKAGNIYFYCVLATLILFILALIITVAIEVPIDNEIKKWTLSTLPPDWADVRGKWEFYHAMRTFISLAGMAFYITAILNRKDGQSLN